MKKRVTAQRDRTLEMANAFLQEVRQDMERAAARGVDLPPRLRSVHVRPGHSTPEYRTLSIPVPPGCAGASPDALSELIARFAAMKPATCLLLALDVLTGDGDGASVLIAEARDQRGTRLFLMQPFRVGEGRLEWGEPQAGGWRDPADDEMILDAAFAGTADILPSIVDPQPEPAPLP